MDTSSPDWGGDISVFEILQQITTQPAPALPGPNEPGGQDFTNDFRQFIAITLKKDPNNRPAPSTLLKHPFVLNSMKQVVDMASWARQYLDPNLNDAQLSRWDVAQRQKRKSITVAKEHRMSLRQGGYSSSGNSTPLATTTDSIPEDELPVLTVPTQLLPNQPPPRKLPINLAPPPLKPKKILPGSFQ